MCHSRPCYNCLNMMKAVGIRKVHYADNDGNLISENVKDMISIQSSYVTRFIDKLNNSVKQTNTEYFENLLKEFLPDKMKKLNFENFVKYNMYNVLPNHTYKFEQIKSNQLIVTILNSSNIKIISTIIY